MRGGLKTVGQQGTGYSVATGLSTTGGSGTGLQVDITAIGESALQAAMACRRQTVGETVVRDFEKVGYGTRQQTE